MKRMREIEGRIRDSKIFRFSICFENYSESLKQEGHLRIGMFDLDGKNFELIFHNPSRFDLFEEDFEVYDIALVKVLQDDTGCIFCFDPEDERLDEISNNDNFVIFARSFSILESE